MIDMAAFMDSFRRKMEARGFRSGWLKDCDVPHHVAFSGFTRERLGDEAYEYKFQEHRWWCSANVSGWWDSVPIRDVHGQTVGRTYRFADQCEATLFGLRFR